MPKRSKVFLPTWIRWVVLPILLVAWGMVTYQTFVWPGGREDLGLVGWVGVTVIVVLVGAMVWLMSSGRLPAYIIEESDDEEGG